jgi:hypothetical protein
MKIQYLLILLFSVSILAAENQSQLNNVSVPASIDTSIPAMNPIQKTYLSRSIQRSKKTHSVGLGLHIPGIALWVGGQTLSIFATSLNQFYLASGMAIIGNLLSATGVPMMGGASWKAHKNASIINFSTYQPGQSGWGSYISGQGLRIVGWVLNQVAFNTRNPGVALASLAMTLTGFALRDIVAPIVFSKRMNSIYDSAIAENLFSLSFDADPVKKYASLNLQYKFN